MQSNDISVFKDSFLAFAKQHLVEIEKSLSEWSSSENKQEVVSKLYLHLHSLNGECGAMRYGSLMKECEKGLSILRPLKENVTNPDNITTLFPDIIGNIKNLLKQVENEQPV